jgi:hypothetical protein
MAEHRRQGGLKPAHSIKVERDIGDAEVLGQFEFAPLGREAAVSAIELDPAGAAEVALCGGRCA